MLARPNIGPTFASWAIYLSDTRVLTWAIAGVTGLRPSVTRRGSFIHDGWMDGWSYRTKSRLHRISLHHIEIECIIIVMLFSILYKSYRNQHTSAVAIIRTQTSNHVFRRHNISCRLHYGDNETSFGAHRP